MAKNERMAQAYNFTLPVPADTLPGTPLRIGVLNVVTLTKEGVGAGNIDGEATCTTRGSWVVSVAGSTAQVKGDAVYITSGNTLTTVASGNTLWGALMQAKASGTALCEVRIVGN